MAKDAKGHGSEARSGHEHAIAKDTVKNPLKGLFLGGPNANQAEATLRGKFGYNDDEISKLKGGGDPRYEDIVSKSPSLGGSQLGGGQPVASNAHAAATLSNGGAKSAPVPLHPGASYGARTGYPGQTPGQAKLSYAQERGVKFPHSG